MTRRLLHLWLIPALALGLVLMGQVGASRGGVSPATGQIVLCTGNGPVTVFVDETGAPTGPPHICPDCVLAALSGLPGAGADLPQRIATAHRLTAVPNPRAAPVQRIARIQARGPPSPV